MQRDQMRQIVNDAVQKSLTESNVTMSAIPSGQLNALVNALADGMFAALSAVEESTDAQPSATPTALPNSFASVDPQHLAEEKLLWRGRPYMTIGTVYELTSQRLRIIRGLLGNQIEEIELIRVRDTKVKQHVGERLLDVGDITVISADSVTPTIVLNNVRNPVEVRELVRKAVQVERQRRGMTYREVLEDNDSGNAHA
ncbi:MAG: PH domain-containing protein [Caldilineaceae bacterium]